MRSLFFQVFPPEYFIDDLYSIWPRYSDYCDCSYALRGRQGTNGILIHINELPDCRWMIFFSVRFLSDSTNLLMILKNRIFCKNTIKALYISNRLHGEKRSFLQDELQTELQRLFKQFPNKKCRSFRSAFRQIIFFFFL